MFTSRTDATRCLSCSLDRAVLLNPAEARPPLALAMLEIASYGETSFLVSQL